MSDSFLTAVFAGLGGMLGWGFADFFAKKTIDRIGDLITLFWAQAIGIIPLLIIFLADPKIPTLQDGDIASLVLFGVIGGLSYLLLYRGFGKGEVSLLSPIFASYAAAVVLISVLFFNESIGNGTIAAITVVLAGILLISSDPRDMRRIFHTRTSKVKGVPEVLTAMLIYSTWLVLFDKFINGRDWVFFLLIIRIISAFTLCALAIQKRQPLVVKDKTLWKLLLGIGLFDVAAYAFVAYGFSHTTHLSVVAVLSAAFSVPTIILAHIFLKEKATKLQMIATVIIITGVILISVA